MRLRLLILLGCGALVTGVVPARAGIKKHAAPPSLLDGPGSPVSITWVLNDEPVDASVQIQPQQLMRALPRAERRHIEGELTPTVVVSLDDTGTFYLAYAQWGAMGGTLFVLRKDGEVASAKHIQARIYDIGHVDAWGNSTKEVVVEKIEGTGMSSHPTSWLFFQVSPKGKLRKVQRVAQSMGYGAKCTRYEFQNQISIPQKGLIRVINLYSNQRTDGTASKRTKHEDSSFELRWQGRRFAKTKLPDTPSDPKHSGCDNPNGGKPILPF